MPSDSDPLSLNSQTILKFDQKPYLDLSSSSEARELLNSIRSSFPDECPPEVLQAVIAELEKTKRTQIVQDAKTERSKHKRDKKLEIEREKTKRHIYWIVAGLTMVCAELWFTKTLHYKIWVAVLKMMEPLLAMLKKI